MDFINNVTGRKKKTKAHDAERDPLLSSQDPLVSQTITGTSGALISRSTDQLTTFRFLVGIISNPSLVQKSSMFKTSARPATNIGLYSHVVKNERSAGKAYKVYSIVINTCLGLQIVVAAALTALGASGSSNGAVTVFGAINTVIAGFLTYLKGSGLPNRLQYYENEWSKLREFIEQQERAFSHEDCPLDLYKVVDAVETMYAEIKADVESNQPDHYISISQLHKGTPPPLAIPSEQFVSASKIAAARGVPEMDQSSTKESEMTQTGKAVQGSSMATPTASTITSSALSGPSTALTAAASATESSDTHPKKKAQP